MKNKSIKIISFLLVTIMILAICSPVKAVTSYVVELTSNSTTVQQGQQIEITIKVKDIVDISGGIAGLSAKLEYDTTKLEKIGEGQSLNGFMLVEGDTIELAKYPGVTSETEIAKFTFKAKENATGETQIKLTGIEVANGTDTFPLGQEVTKTILITSTTTEQPSSNNNLSSSYVDGTTTNDDTKNDEIKSDDIKSDDTKSNTKLPNTGSGEFVFGILGTVIIIGIISFIKTRKLSGI